MSVSVIPPNQPFLNDYPTDMGEKVLCHLDARDIVSIACVSLSCHQWIPDCTSIIPLPALQEILGSTFRFINMTDKTPPVYRFGVIKAWEAVVRKTTGKEQAGMTLLALPEGLTFRKFLEVISKEKVVYSQKLFDKAADIPLKTLEVMVITNSMLEMAQNPGEEPEEVAKKAGCEVPGFLAYAVLCALTYQKYQVFVYKDHPEMITSTVVGGKPIVFSVKGGNHPSLPYTLCIGNAGNIGFQKTGTAGCRKV
jgi:hypothetical protein